MINCNKVINVELNDPWCNAYVSDTATRRPNDTRVLWPAEFSQNWLDKGRCGEVPPMHMAPVAPCT